MLGRTAADLDLESKAVRVTGLSQQLLRLLRIVSEELLDRVGHLRQRLEVTLEIRMLRVSHELGIAVVVGVNDLLLVDRHVQSPSHSLVIERLGVGTQSNARAIGR